VGATHAGAGATPAGGACRVAVRGRVACRDAARRRVCRKRRAARGPCDISGPGSGAARRPRRTGATRRPPGRLLAFPPLRGKMPHAARTSTHRAGWGLVGRTGATRALLMARRGDGSQAAPPTPTDAHAAPGAA